MTWTIYEFLNIRGQGIIEIWVQEERLQKAAIAQLNLKIDLLEQSGPDLSPKLLAGTGKRHIYKLRIHVPKMQLRPLLCRGPIAPHEEFTFLLGAIERNRRLEPANALTVAETKRQTILADQHRRRRHEHPF